MQLVCACKCDGKLEVPDEQFQRLAWVVQMGDWFAPGHNPELKSDIISFKGNDGYIDDLTAVTGKVILP